MRLIPSRLSLCLVLPCLFLSQQLVHANLVFEQETLQLKADLGQETLEAIFKFVNKGSEPITITKVKPTCGCTIANIKDEQVYAPGESGEIRADFSVDGRRGTKDVKIAVQTSGGVNYRLGLSVEIPTVLEIKPKVLTWRLGALDEVRSTEVILQEGAGYTLKEPENLPEGVTYTVEGGEKGVYTYRFQVSTTLKKGVHKLPFLAVAKDGSAVSEQLFLMVRK
ncbi:MAG: DUF1573 domain-containing protein [Opitutaceae bacterium]